MDADAAALYISIIAIIISVVGWLVVHLLALRTQKQALVNSLTNDARLAITNGIRDHHDCCIEIISKATGASVDEILARAGAARPHAVRSMGLRELCFDPRTHLWLRSLEEYESLFPETAAIRIELLHLNSRAIEAMRRFADQYERGVYKHDSHELNATVEQIWDVVGLTWDLLVHVQNNSIGRITGHKVPARQVASSHFPTLGMNTTGMLTITRTDQNGPMT